MVCPSLLQILAIFGALVIVMEREIEIARPPNFESLRNTQRLPIIDAEENRALPLRYVRVSLRELR